MFRSHIADGIAIVSIDRPEARNAIAIADWEQLAAICEDITAADVRAVLLRSAVSGIFSAGADIGEFDLLQRDESERRRFREAMRAGIDAVYCLPVPVVAAVSGGCYGAAVALMLAADFCIADENARFAVTPARLGLGYPREDVSRLVSRVGEAQAALMLFTGEPVDAQRALELGLVQRLGDDAGHAANVMLEEIAGNAPQAIHLLKKTLRDTGDPAIDGMFDDRFASDEFAKRLSAFRTRKSA